MTEIEFHVNLPDKLHYSCRLMRKAHRSGIKVVVTAEPELLAQLDELLWRFSSYDFLPHCLSTASASVLAVTPILLTQQLQSSPPDSVLINLGQNPPAHFECFQRFIELASNTNDDISAARTRWKFYRDRGYPLKRHEPPTASEPT